MCNDTSGSQWNSTLCDVSESRPRPRPGSRSLQCYTCSQTCIFKSIELVYLVGVVANIIVVARVIFDKRLHKPTFVAVACLAISDAVFVTAELIVAFDIVITSLAICPLVRPQTIGGVFSLFDGIFWFAANGHLTLLAIVRFLLIVYPIKSLIHLTIKRVILSSVCIWVLGILIASSFYIHDKVNGRNDAKSPKRTFILWLVVYLVPFVATSVLHLVKLRLVRHASRDKGNSDVSGIANRMTRIILLVIVTAFLFPMPKFIYDIFIRFQYKFRTTRSKLLFHDICTLLFYLNNTTNPFVYALLSEPFRRSIGEMFKCKTCQEPKEHGENAKYGAIDDTGSHSLKELVTDSPHEDEEN